jgi:hypothetical protein
VSGDGEPPRLAYRIDHRPLLAAMSEQNCSLWTGSERPPRGGFSVCICSIMLQRMSPLLAQSGHSVTAVRCPLLGEKRTSNYFREYALSGAASVHPVFCASTFYGKMIEDRSERNA